MYCIHTSYIYTDMYMYVYICICICIQMNLQMRVYVYVVSQQKFHNVTVAGPSGLFVLIGLQVVVGIRDRLACQVECNSL